MSNSLPDITVAGIDTKALSSLIIEFNIAHRNYRSYPPGHPLIESSLKKLLTRYDELMEQQYELSIGVARDTLMFENINLDKNNPVYRDFARSLFQCGIGGLIFRPGLKVAETKSFLDILDMKRDEISQAGGIDAVWQRSGIESLGIHAIRYDLFTASEGDSGSSDQAVPGEGLWERFVRGLIEGNLNTFGDSQGHLDPELLADVLNKRYSGSGAERQGDYAKTITDFIHTTSQKSSVSDSSVSEKMVRFITSLNPELRRQFLSSAFKDAGPDGESFTKRLQSDMKSEAVLQVLDDINRQQLTISPVIMGLLQKLSLHATPKDSNTQKAETEREEFNDRIQTILREQDSEVYIPADYQLQLDTLAAASHLPLLRSDEIEPFLMTIDSHQIESHINAILLELIADEQNPAECELLAKSLSDMGNYFLQTGDYADYLAILEQAGDTSKPESFRQILLAHCTGRDCLEEILEGLHVWGKSRYDQIKNLISNIGTPFIEPLLDHLADEESLSLRRFLMERLAEFGPAACKPILARLNDKRWYFLRNLIILLKNIHDPEVLAALRPLIRHAHPRVRQEAFKTLLSCRDSFAERLILNDLESSNRETQLAAIQLAEATKSPACFNRLLQILAQGGLNATQVDIKSAIVKALGEFGRADALPELTRILFSRHLLYAKSLSRLKLEIVASLERYPLVAVQLLLQKTAGGNDDVSSKAGDVLRSMLKGKQK
jgi:hypothetical protein